MPVDDLGALHFDYQVVPDERFFAFFPCARLLILVRDGRSVVQSAVDTFGWDFDTAWEYAQLRGNPSKRKGAAPSGAP